MAARRPPASSSLWFPPLSSLFLPRGDTLLYLIGLFSIISLLLHHLAVSSVYADDSHFEGFDADDDDPLDEPLAAVPIRSSPPPTTLSHSDPVESHHGPPDPSPSLPPPSTDSSPPTDLNSKPSSTSLDYWDEDEFEGLPVHQPTPEAINFTEDATMSDLNSGVNATAKSVVVSGPKSYIIEIVCGSFLIMFIVNYFTGKRENENIALAWLSKFALNNSIFEKNFSFLGVEDGDDKPLLLKEGQNVFKFYASGRRYCQGLLATMELKSRHDLISRLFNLIVPCKDEITFEVYLNEDSMDHIVFAVAKKKAAKIMHKELRDLNRFANFVSPPSNKKWVAEDLMVISESKEVAGDLISDGVLDQVLGEKAFEKFGKSFISMHFSDQHLTTHRKMLVFKFAIPGADHMADIAQLVALVPYYIDIIGRYKLSPQVRAKAEATRLKFAQEEYKELQNARQEALQKKKVERRKKLEEAEAKLGAEAVRKKEAKERARQMKKMGPKIKMTRAQ